MHVDQFNLLVKMLGPLLTAKDNKFRKGIKGQERIMLALSQLAGSKRFTQASKDWDRGKTTMHEALTNFCNAVIDILGPRLIRIPVGEEA